MVLDIINSKREQYKKHILNKTKYDSIYKWDALQQFQENWDVNAEDFKQMYEKSFSDEIASDLWESEDFYPKRAMLELLDYNQEKVRIMFKNLLNEEKDIDTRVEFFLFDCNTLRNEIIKTNPEFMNHYHGGFSMISIYLAFKYPAKYCVYQYPAFKKFMESVKSKTIPSDKEIVRFFKVMRTVNILITKDEDLVESHKNIRTENKTYLDESLLLAQDFYCNSDIL